MDFKTQMSVSAHFRAIARSERGSRLVSRVKWTAACFALTAAMEREAHGYTDPGTGALLWQVLAAGFVGALFYLRKITSWLKGRKKNRNG
jgi:hypothetical protein